MKALAEQRAILLRLLNALDEEDPSTSIEEDIAAFLAETPDKGEEPR